MVGRAANRWSRSHVVSSLALRFDALLRCSRTLPANWSRERHRLAKRRATAPANIPANSYRDFRLPL